MNLGPLEEQPVLLSTEPSLQPLYGLFEDNCVLPSWTAPASRVSDPSSPSVTVRTSSASGWGSPAAPSASGCGASTRRDSEQGGTARAHNGSQPDRPSAAASPASAIAPLNDIFSLWPVSVGESLLVTTGTHADSHLILLLTVHTKQVGP